MRLISFRRYYLDNALFKIKFSGKVLDIGGQKVKHRGCFNRSLEKGDYGRAAYKRASSAFSIDDTIEKYTKLYENILEGKKYN